MEERIKIRTTVYPLIIILIISLSSCFSQSRDIPVKNYSTFREKFNLKFNDYNLLIGCLVYSKNINSRTLLVDNDVFLEIAGDFQSKLPANIDSMVDEFVEQHKTIPYASDSLGFFLHSFIINYEIVKDVVFANVESDADSAAIANVDEKILNVPDMASIYRLYIGQHGDLSSLSSGGGIALYIQMAYYLFLQDKAKRNEILKNLL